MILPDQDAVTPAGRPVQAPIPVAPVVLCVIAVNGVLIHSVGVDEAAEAFCNAETVSVPVAVAEGEQPLPEVVIV